MSNYFKFKTQQQGGLWNAYYAVIFTLFKTTIIQNKLNDGKS